MEEYMIQTFGLSKTFKKRTAVEDLNLKVRKGEIYGFLGPNGAGKTTTIRMLLGLARPTGGRIEMFGKSIHDDRKAILKKTGSLVESPSYYGHLTAYENLEVLRRLLEVPKSRIGEVLAIVRLTKEAGRPVKGFSLGMKQRLGIAAAMLADPKLLILDEPTNGLDPSGIQEIRELIKSLPKQHGTTILVSSHLLSEIDLMATQLGIIVKGKMIFQDSIEEIRKLSGSRLSLRVDQPVMAAKMLTEAGCQAETADGKLYLEGMTDTKIASVIEELVLNKHKIYRVQEEKKSLEQIFLEITGGQGGL